ncbi:MAG: HypC/HybG/HupF family hydrogenase formation chaperone [Armatimonadetes bacterium CG07_land_8_20_14_0_80_40_9]|nr:MAG: HypC/HybG/HupF family hydrogenase formation chaperone [Armatimonadetes bacterium CG07_land_8_20_14_0_80_40_9]
MCLAIPTKVIEIKGNLGVVEFGGVRKDIGLSLLPELKIGDWVLLHAGFAIQKLDEEEAEETLRLLEEISEVSG